MPKVTAIEAQKRKGRRNVFVDGAFWAGLSEFVLAKHGLAVGRELTEEQMRRILFDEEYERQMAYAARLLAGSDRTLKEIAERFRRRKVPEEVSRAVLAKLEGFGLVGDEAYIRKYVEARPGYGFYYYLAKFKEKGIPYETARRTLEEALTPEREAEYASSFLASKARRWKGLDRRDYRRKAVAALKARGFRAEAIRSCLKDAAVEEEP